MTDTKFRIKFNTNTIIKSAEILSNGVILTANAYMIGSGLRSSARERQRQRVHDTLQTSADIATSAANLTKVLAETIGAHYGKGG